MEFHSRGEEGISPQGPIPKKKKLKKSRRKKLAGSKSQVPPQRTALELCTLKCDILIYFSLKKESVQDSVIRGTFKRAPPPNYLIKKEKSKISFVFLSVAILCMRMTPRPRSTAGVPSDRALLDYPVLLRTTCMRSYWSTDCVAP